jgi:hypothetical protein
MPSVLEWAIGPGPRPHNNSRLTRTLYAPDNPNQPAQADGKDVQAIKRKGGTDAERIRTAER